MELFYANGGHCGPLDAPAAHELARKLLSSKPETFGDRIDLYRTSTKDDYQGSYYAGIDGNVYWSPMLVVAS